MSDLDSAILFSMVGVFVLLLCLLFVLYRRSISEGQLVKGKLIESNMHLEYLQAEIVGLEEELVREKEEKSSVQSQYYYYEKELGIAQEKLRGMTAQMEDWEKTKAQILKDTKAAMFDSGGEMFKQEADKLGKKTQESFEQVLKTVASLNERLGQNEKLVNTVWSALSTPHAVGNFSEIGLENTLKNYGLMAERDFIMQYSVKSSEGDVRPDAVVFLSAGNVMVIDSKASKFFLESEVDTDDCKQERLEKLKKSMNDHLKSLSSKAYHETVKAYLKAGKKEQRVNHVYTIMFVHNEAVLNKLLEVDTSFMQKAQEKDIVVSGPTGLAAAMSLARFDIVSQKQSENHGRIVSEVSALLGSLETLLRHAERMGKGVNSVATHFQKFTSSVNGSFLPKARKLAQLGVTLPKNKTLPKHLPSVHLVTEDSGYIEGETADAIESIEMEKKTHEAS